MSLAYPGENAPGEVRDILDAGPEQILGRDGGARAYLADADDLSLAAQLGYAAGQLSERDAVAARNPRLGALPGLPHVEEARRRAGGEAAGELARAELGDPRDVRGGSEGTAAAAERIEAHWKTPSCKPVNDATSLPRALAPEGRGAHAHVSPTESPMSPSPDRAATAARRGRLWRLSVIAFGHFAHDVFTAFFAPLLPIIRETIGISFAEAGVLTALQRVPALANPLLGVIADRRGQRVMLVLAPSLSAVAMSFIGVAGSRWSLGLMLLVAGIGSALWHVPAPVILGRLGGRRLGLGMSLFMVAGEGARTAGPFVALGLVSWLGPIGLTALLPLAFATSLALLWATRDLERHAPRPKVADGEREPWAPLVRLFAAIALVIGGRAFLVAALATYLPVFVVERGGSVWLGGAALGLLQGAGAAGALASGTLSDKLGRRRVLLIVAVLSPPAMLAFVHASPAMMAPLLIVLGLLAFSSNPPLLALVQEKAGSRPALATGIFMALGFVLRSGVVVLVGAVADARGLATAFELAALLAICAVGGVLCLPRVKTT